MKICTKCGFEKEDDQFPKKKNKCKLCISEYQKQYRQDNKYYLLENKKKYYQNNIIKIKKSQKNYRIITKGKRLEYHKIYRQINNKIIIKNGKIYYKNNRGKILEKNKKYYKNNKNIIIKKNLIYYLKNRNYINKRKNYYIKNKRKTNHIFRLRCNFSSLIRISFKKQKISKKGLSYIKFLSYTIQQLKEHLESQFEDWMTWHNHGNYRLKTWDDNDKSTWTWQVDHIIPQSKLPYSSMEEENFKKCWALENLRPLSAKQNILDGDRR